MSFRAAALQVLQTLYRPSRQFTDVWEAVEVVARILTISIPTVAAAVVQHVFPATDKLYDWVLPLFTFISAFAVVVFYTAVRIQQQVKPPLSTEDLRHRKAFHGDVQQTYYPSADRPNDMPYVQFTTENDLNRRIVLHYRPRALRFLTHGQKVVRSTDVPARVDLDRGHIIVKDFLDEGCIIEEVDTAGERIRVELYLDVEGRPWTKEYSKGRLVIHADPNANSELSGRLVND